MIGTNVEDLDLSENWYADDDSVGWRDAFPFTPALGGSAETEDITVVYFEFDEGKGLGRHTDSEEELVFVVEGTVAVTVDDETSRYGSEALVVVPKNRPHSIQNVGDGVVRGLAVFPSTEVTTAFDEPVQPFGQRVFGPTEP